MSQVIDQTVNEVLEQHRGKRAFRVPMHDSEGVDFGNNGDDLIQFGGELLLSKYDIAPCDDRASADLHIIRGNGAMIQAYKMARRVFEHAWNDYPDTPLLMLPATFHYPGADFFGGLKKRSAPVTLFCREKYSFEHLQNENTIPEGCSVGLGHDTAFQLKDDPIVQNYLGREGKHVLMVERNDFEHPSKNQAVWSNAGSSPKLSVFSKVPPIFKKPFYPIRSMLRRRKQTPFRAFCERKLQEDHAEFAKLPRIFADVSDRTVCNFEGFCEQIATAAVVFSTRLHVGIYAAMLGKPTYVFEGPYHKIRAIYEHSMADMDHVRFVSREQYL
ncbi:MAG: polysaccharide pyruvyl transferase family protein [Planctomycetales bacterium]|nr:polysaccharide pyruvyl transferase family protein [Planctomycetales bacterium]